MFAFIMAVSIPFPSGPMLNVVAILLTISWHCLNPFSFRANAELFGRRASSSADLSQSLFLQGQC